MRRQRKNKTCRIFFLRRDVLPRLCVTSPRDCIPNRTLQNRHGCDEKQPYAVKASRISHIYGLSALPCTSPRLLSFAELFG